MSLPLLLFGEVITPRRAFGVGFWWIQQSQVNGLSGLEIKSRRFLKVKGHSAFRNLNSIQERRTVAN